jgi:transketolase
MSGSTEQLARAIRADALRMVHRARASHIGSALSVADVLAVLYGEVLRHDPANPTWDARDIMIASKGHAAAAVYSVLARTGYFPPSLLNAYQEDGSPLAGHLTRAELAPGVEWSTGSLGHGLPVGVGIALSRARRSRPGRVFVILSDGECDEGTTWESALLAAHHRLSNLVAIVDANGIQSFGRTADVLDLEPLAAKWQAFGWTAIELDGHDHGALAGALAAGGAASPTAIIARTVKGAGVSFMQDDLAWHYRSPTDEQLAAALAELGVE